LSVYRAIIAVLFTVHFSFVYLFISVSMSAVTGFWNCL